MSSTRFLAGKVALVSGSTQGIGHGMLRALAGAGAGESSESWVLFFSPFFQFFSHHFFFLFLLTLRFATSTDFLSLFPT